MSLIKNNLLISLILVYFSSCAQTQNKNQKIISATNQLVMFLHNCDTSGALSLLDTTFAHTNESNYRTYFKETFLKDCSRFNEIIDKYGMPNINNITLKKDSSQSPPANFSVLPILSKADTGLNMKKCFLMLAFYPDEFFTSNSHLLKYTLVVEPLKVVNKDKIEIPEWIKKLGDN